MWGVTYKNLPNFTNLFPLILINVMECKQHYHFNINLLTPKSIAFTYCLFQGISVLCIDVYSISDLGREIIYFSF